jgi:riboflavin synthase
VFTGIVEELGAFVSRRGDVHLGGGSERVRFAARIALADSRLGDSIAVNGCCLTLVEQGDGWWEADLSGETLARTTLGSLRAGDPVNLERPLRLADRLGGHLVQGHVDAVGTVTAEAPDLRVRVPGSLLRYCVEKGSMTVDGVSLTIVDVLPDTLATDQAHPEGDDAIVARWAADERDEIGPDIVDRAVAEMSAAGPDLARWWRPVASAFAGLVAGHSASVANQPDGPTAVPIRGTYWSK